MAFLSRIVPFHAILITDTLNSQQRCLTVHLDHGWMEIAYTKNRNMYTLIIWTLTNNQISQCILYANLLNIRRGRNDLTIKTLHQCNSFDFFDYQLFFFFELFVLSTCKIKHNIAIFKLIRREHRTWQQCFAIYKLEQPFPGERLWSNSRSFSWFLLRISLISRGLLGFATKTCKRIGQTYPQYRHDHILFNERGKWWSKRMLSKHDPQTISN